jgi:hypothetical protein
MKVYEGPGPILPKTSKPVKKNLRPGGEFNKIMEQMGALNERKETTTTGAENARLVLDRVNNVSSADRVQETEDINDKKMVVGTLKETLDLVDFYASKLADSTLPASGLTPLIDHLEEKLEILNNMESSAGMSEKMRPIISDLKMAIGTEIAKFRRGDYL